MTLLETDHVVTGAAGENDVHTWSAPVGPDERASRFRRARPYLVFLGVIALTIGTLCLLALWGPHLAGASAPGGCGGG
jgi:hypothetical protein